MSFKQSRAEKSESHYSRKPGRPGNPVYQRVSSGGSGKGGGGTGLPPASSNYQSSSPSTNRSSKRSNGQGAQSRAPAVSLKSDSSAVQNGAPVLPSPSGASNAPVSDASFKPDSYSQRSKRSVPRAQTSQSAPGVSDSRTPATPMRGDSSRGVSLQFGSFSPGLVNGVQIPARTSSAPPNLDEQKRDQARHDSFKPGTALPTSSNVNQQQPRADTDQSKNRVSQPPAQAKRDVHAQGLAAPVVTSTHNSSALPASGVSITIPLQQPQIPVQFGVPGPQFQGQGVVATSIQMPLPLPVGNLGQVRPPVFVPGLQHHPLQPQGMLHQGHSMNFSPQIGHQVGSQLGNLGFGIPPQLQQQAGTFVPRKPVKITHPETHEVLRLDKRADVNLDGGSSGPGSHSNVPLQLQHIPYGASHQMNYFSHLQKNPIIFSNPTSIPLTTTQMTPNRQASGLQSAGGQGSKILDSKNAPSLNPLSVATVDQGMHGMAVSSSLEHATSAKAVISATVSASFPVTGKPNAGGEQSKPVPKSASVVSSLETSCAVTSSAAIPGERFQSQDVASISMPIDGGRTERQQHSQSERQAETLDSVDCSKTKTSREVAVCPGNMRVSPSEEIRPSTSTLPSPPLALIKNISEDGISETMECKIYVSSETFADASIITVESLPDAQSGGPVALVEGIAAVRVEDGSVCETSNKFNVKTLSDTVNGINDAKQEDCVPLDIQLNEGTIGSVEQQRTELVEQPQLDNDNKVYNLNISVDSSSFEPLKVSDQTEGINIALTVSCSEIATSESKQNVLEGEAGSEAGSGSLETDKRGNSLVTPTAPLSDSTDSDVGAHNLGSLKDFSEENNSTLEASKSRTGSVVEQEVSFLESEVADQDTAPIPIPLASAVVSKVGGKANGDLVHAASSGLKDKPILDPNRLKSATSKNKKKRKEILQKADAAGTSSDIYMAYKGPEEKPKPSVSSEGVDSSSSVSVQRITSSCNEENVAAKENDEIKAEPDDWEDAANISTPKLEISDNVEKIQGILRHHEGDGTGVTFEKKYSRDFLLTLSPQCTDLPVGFSIAYDMGEALMGSKANISKVVDLNPYPSIGRIIDSSSGGVSQADFRRNGMVDDDRWIKSPRPFALGQDPRVEISQGGNVFGIRPGQGVNHGFLKNIRGQTLGQNVGGFPSGPLLSLIPQGGIQRNGPDADRWQRATGFQKGLIPCPQSPLQVMHKAAKKYEFSKVTDAEEAKQRQLRAILNKLTPQNFDRLFEQVKEVNIENAATLAGVISQIFDKALMEPTFCEMYANFCYHLAGELPDFVEDDEKITFKRLLLNKCQEEFERGEREQAEASRVEGDADVKQSEAEREEKRIQARRQMLGNIRLIGELYKKKMLTERIMRECIQKLLGQYENPDEEDIEALCKLMSTIGEMIDHPRAKEYMDRYFGMMAHLSNNMKLSSRVRFMLKDAIDLRRNKWQQRRKVEGPKKIEEVHRDAAQERQAQVSRLSGPSINSGRRGQPVDFGPRTSSMLPPPNTQMGSFRGLPSQIRGFSTQDVQIEERHPYENRISAVPLSHRPVDDNTITLGPKGGLVRGMSVRGQPILSGGTPVDAPTGYGESRRMPAGPSGHSSASEWTPYYLRQDPLSRHIQERSIQPPAYDQSNRPGHSMYCVGRDLTNADHSFDKSMAASPSTPLQRPPAVTHNVPLEKVLPEERLRDMSMAAIREFYSARDENEVASCIRDLNSPSYYPSMVSVWINDSFERKDRDRDLLARLLVNLTKSRDGMLNTGQLIEGFELVLATLEDALTDTPKAAESLGRIFARIITENVISLREIGQLIQEGGEKRGRLLQIGLGFEVLESAFKAIRSEKGESVLSEFCRSSNIQLEDFRSGAIK